MPRRYSFVCDNEIGDRVEDLAREYDLTEEAVLRQLIERGLEQAEAERPGRIE